MKNRNELFRILFVLALVLLPATLAATEAEPTVDEQVASLQQMCTDTAEARAQRHADKPLYDRLGGYDRILELTTEVVRLHDVNEAFTRFMPDVDKEKLAKNVADFVSTGTGGPAKYTGRDMPTAHAHLELTNADFMAAGGDVITAMKTLEYGQEEIDEFVCILVSMKDMVVVEHSSS